MGSSIKKWFVKESPKQYRCKRSMVIVAQSEGVSVEKCIHCNKTHKYVPW